MSCGKVHHRSRGAANAVCRRIGIVSLVPYFCRPCRGWHLGNNRKLAGARIDQLLKEAAARDARVRARSEV